MLVEKTLKIKPSDNREAKGQVLAERFDYKLLAGLISWLH